MMGMVRACAAEIRRLMFATVLASASAGIAAARRSWASMISSCENALWHSGIAAW